MRGEITGKSPVDNKVEEEGTDEPELLMAERRTSRAEGEADLVGTTRVRPSNAIVGSMPVPTELTDVVIDRDIHLGVQLQGEDICGREKVTRLLPDTPRVLPPSTAKDRTVRLRHGSVGGRERPVTPLTVEVEAG